MRWVLGACDDTVLIFRFQYLLRTGAHIAPRFRKAFQSAGLRQQQEKLFLGRSVVTRIHEKNAFEIFSKEHSQSADFKSKAAKSVQVDKQYYTLLTDALLEKFYPKFCKCSSAEQLTLTDGKRDIVLRCPECHKQQSKIAGTPLNYLNLPRWMFGYLLKEAQLQYPKVLTITEISKRVGFSYTTAMKLKRRLQLFAAETVPRMQRKFYTDNKLKFAEFRFPKDRSLDLTEMVKDKQVPQAENGVLHSCSTAANKGRKRFKRRGKTSSIYMSESLGGKQVGTLVNTMAIKQGPVFYGSVPNQKAETINPILNQYVPLHNPLFTDEGYRGYT